MDELVRIEIEVTAEAAALLRDEERRRSVGRMVSELVGRKGTEEHPLRLIFCADQERCTGRRTDRCRDRRGAKRASCRTSSLTPARSQVQRSRHRPLPRKPYYSRLLTIRSTYPSRSSKRFGKFS